MVWVLLIFVITLVIERGWHEHLLSTERENNRQERDKLAQRIQAPELAVLPTVTPAPSPKTIPFDDDAAYHDYLSNLN